MTASLKKLAFLQRSVGDLDDSVATLKRSLALNPADATTLALLGAYLNEAGRAPETVELLSVFVDQEAPDGDVLQLLASPEVGASAIDELPFKPLDLAELVELVSEGRVTRASGRTLLRAMFDAPRAPKELMHELGLERVDDSAALEAWCRAALEGRDDVVADVRAGKEKALGALMGPVMQASAGKAEPRAVREMLLRLIRGEG